MRRSPSLPRRARGFTLLEIMVVVVLIGITATLISLNLRPDVERQAELEARRFAGLLEQLREESILAGRAMAVEIDSKDRSYRFFVARDGWQPLERDEMLRRRQLPEFLSLQLELAEAAADDATNRIVCQPGGEITPFTLIVRARESAYRVTLDAAYNLAVDRVVPGAA